MGVEAAACQSARREAEGEEQPRGRMFALALVFSASKIISSWLKSVTRTVKL